MYVYDLRLIVILFLVVSVALFKIVQHRHRSKATSVDRLLRKPVEHKHESIKGTRELPAQLIIMFQRRR